MITHFIIPPDERAKNACLLYAAASVLNVAPTVLLDELAVRYDEETWPQFLEPGCYRSLHIQEIQNLFLFRGFALALVEPCPLLGPLLPYKDLETTDWESLQVFDPEVMEKRMIEILKKTEGILLSETHAYAWDGRKLYDPNGPVTEWEKADVNIREYWMCTRLGPVRPNP
jgi:hypothetical protein